MVCTVNTVCRGMLTSDPRVAVIGAWPSISTRTSPSSTANHSRVSGWKRGLCVVPGRGGDVLGRQPAVVEQALAPARLAAVRGLHVGQLDPRPHAGGIAGQRRRLRRPDRCRDRRRARDGRRRGVLCACVGGQRQSEARRPGRCACAHHMSPALSRRHLQTPTNPQSWKFPRHRSRCLCDRGGCRPIQTAARPSCAARMAHRRPGTRRERDDR